MSDWIDFEFERICDEIEAEDSIEVVGPQIELDLGQESFISDVEPPVEVPRVIPTVVVKEEEDSSVEVLASIEKKERDQAEGTGAVLVPEAAEIALKDQSERTAEETVHVIEEARTGAEPVHEYDRSGEEPNLMEVEGAVGTGEPVLEEAMEGTGGMPVQETGAGDLHFEDYPGDDFEKVGEYTQEETSQTPLTPAPEHPTEETRSSAKPQRKRFKTLAGWTDLPCVRKLIALKAKSSSSSKQPPQKQPSQPTRKSYRLAGQGGVRSSSTNQGPPVIEKIPSLSEGSPMKTPKPVVVP